MTAPYQASPPPFAATNLPTPIFEHGCYDSCFTANGHTWALMSFSKNPSTFMLALPLDDLPIGECLPGPNQGGQVAMCANPKSTFLGDFNGMVDQLLGVDVTGEKTFCTSRGVWTIKRSESELIIFGRKGASPTDTQDFEASFTKELPSGATDYTRWVSLHWTFENGAICTSLGDAYKSDGKVHVSKHRGGCSTQRFVQYLKTLCAEVKAAR